MNFHLNAKKSEKNIVNVCVCVCVAGIYSVARKYGNMGKEKETCLYDLIFTTKERGSVKERRQKKECVNLES